MSAKALPELLEKAVIPTVEQPQIKISKLTIENFVKPEIKANFVDGLGMSVSLLCHFLLFFKVKIVE